MYNEMSGEGVRGVLLEQEPFAAIGQWGCVAIVILVLFAAVVGRIWDADESGRRVCSVAAEEIRSLEKGDESRDEDWTGIEE